MIRKKDLLERIESLECQIKNLTKEFNKQAENVAKQALLIHSLTKTVDQIADRQLNDDLAEFVKFMHEIIAEEPKKAKRASTKKTEKSKNEEAKTKKVTKKESK